MPTVLGHEAAGIVRVVGLGVTQIKVDDHVVMVFVMSCSNCTECSGGRLNRCTASVAAKFEGE